MKKFGELVAVNDISFTVGERELFGLLGPNGAGKTTLIRMLTTLTPPTSGTALIAGHDIVKDADGVRSGNRRDSPERLHPIPNSPTSKNM